ncbi:hypothetical protein K505DRAFT_355284 [Melanomma pulvis-pyrius CBS 109.77]|uniref:Uncharacterized protein n=1 Tax=Melanomma pulvis-pyrius CBS 109.77 TaxID=1314802 RepID=A0A6A6XX86_9PLEO|nr:hypothetical protein K505DRAFT_355284 [Melanomma pulvis-pyrius CBS 109.77]
MDALKEVQLMAEFKKLILDQLHAIFGPKYRQGVTFAVTTSCVEERAGQDTNFHAQAIVYTQANSSREWELLRESGGFKSISSAMGALLGDLQVEMTKITRPMQYGDIYDGKGYVL